MATNIIEAIQMRLGYAQIQKVDPNSQDIKKSTDPILIEKLGQAAIPAVLTALYHYTRTDNGCRQLLANTENRDWLTEICAGREKLAVENVAKYAGVTLNQAASHMETIADEAVQVVRTAVGPDATPEKIKTYMNSQRHNILVYLPAALNMGDVLNDETLDDKTNKMEGPVSSFMARTVNTLSDGDRKKGLF